MEGTRGGGGLARLVDANKRPIVSSCYFIKALVSKQTQSNFSCSFPPGPKRIALPISSLI